MNWFFCYNNGDESLLSNIYVKNGHFPVCENINGVKRFTVFRTIYSIYLYIVESIETRRCLYEIVRDSNFQKPYFDIDICLIKDSSFLSRDDKIAISEQLPSILIDSILKTNSNIKMTDIMVFNSHSNEKRSFHVIIDRWCFINSFQNKKFFERVLEKIPEIWKQFFDQTMYKSVQQFRFYMCTKSGSERYKRLDPIESRWIIDDSTPIGEENYEIFLSSCITYTEKCQIIESEDFITEIKTYEELEYSREDIKRMTVIINRMRDSNCFRLDSIDGSIAVLRRLHPSKCKNCSEKYGYEKIHESENAFVYLCKGGNVCFDCRRGGGPQIIGNINDRLILEKEKKHKQKKLNIIVEEDEETKVCDEIKNIKKDSPICVSQRFSPTETNFEGSNSSENSKTSKYSDISKQKINELKERRERLSVADRLLLI